MDPRRPILFLGGCVPARLGLAAALLVACGPKHSARQTVVACTLAVVAVGFAVIYAAGLRRTGPETFGMPIWWDAFRPLHAAAYGTAALALAIGGHHRLSAGVLAVDALVGLTAWTICAR